MTTDINGTTYVIGKLSAMEQLHVARRLAPVLASLIPAFVGNPGLFDKNEDEGGGADAMMIIASGPVAETLSKMSNEDVDYVVNACLSVCEWKQAKNFAKVMVNKVLMKGNLELDELMGLTIAVIQENLGRFFPTSQPDSRATE